MIKIYRSIHKQFITDLKPNKVYLLLGARRVGKTFLLKEVEKAFPGKTMFLNAEDMTVQQILADRSIANYRRLLAGIDLLIIDEAQVIPEIGKVLKLMVDEIEGIKIIATGSSAFDLLNISGEPLTGRSYSHTLFPLAQMELNSIENMVETRQNLPDRLVFGSYPELFQLATTKEKEDYLTNIINSYLLKDILALDGLRNASKLLDLLKLLAYQVGKEVNYHELGGQLGMSKNTVEKYLDLLTKVFVIFKLGGYSKNLRKEISKGNKWYFLDNGIRNILISNMNPISIRQDIGELWENYIISERIKRNNYLGINANYYYWRTYDQQEIDFIEIINGKENAYEFKWKEGKSKVPKAWFENYPGAGFAVVNQNNYLDFII